MTFDVWVCARDPAVEILALPLHPFVILLALFAALTFEARGRQREQIFARALWRGLLVAAVLIGAFFLAASLLVRFAFGANPTLLLDAVPYARMIIGWSTVGLVWRRFSGSNAEPGLRKPRTVWSRHLILALVLALLAMPWLSNVHGVIGAPYAIGRWLVEWPTGSFASDECLASRVIDDGADNGLFWPPGQVALSELQSRGASTVRGMSSALYDRLDMDALRDDYVSRHSDSPWEKDEATEAHRRAYFGVSYLLAEVGKRGGAQPVLYAWKTRAPSDALRTFATSVLDGIRLRRRAQLSIATTAGCALPGEVCENGKCSKILGEE